MIFSCVTDSLFSEIQVLPKKLPNLVVDCGVYWMPRQSKLEYVTKSNKQEFKFSNNMIQTAANIP